MNTDVVAPRPGNDGRPAPTGDAHTTAGFWRAHSGQHRPSSIGDIGTRPASMPSARRWWAASSGGEPSFGWRCSGVIFPDPVGA